MLRQDLTSINASNNHAADSSAVSSDQSERNSEAVYRLDIQQSLNVLEELILASPRIPFSGRTLVDEDQLLEQLDRIRLNLPTVFQEAIQILHQRDRILNEANQYAQELVNTADKEAARRLDDLGIVQQAETRAHQVKQQLEEECDTLRSQTQSDIQDWQEAAQQYWEKIKQQTEMECQSLRNDADLYAAEVLQRIEQQLSDMMRVIQNGRTALPPATTTTEVNTRIQETTPHKAKGHPQGASDLRQSKSRRNAS
ncbi:DivIVA domain-containing protein [Oscillatoria sp. CS-180]|uniref:DivIVA domain-containing protein n=1 Tax=Oscillatoria sp. CS-180 TaxID=3021720 RepID=UPI00232F7748|nr:DivIVA domain-containing protein [Oscillatoria sp. CS-180]MDB9526840.1 DivIVA domain-containing protein [Oscillatoria sp. CS-180]